MSVEVVSAMICPDGKHDLTWLHCCGPDMEERVVRWCIRCGGVSIDCDSDGRTSPGHFMRMRLPELAEQDAKKG
jgi:hypothetical protein